MSKACDPQTFANFTPENWTTAQGEVKAQLGIDITAPAGEATERGFTIAWTYDAGAQTLTITCVDKPFFIPCGVINGQIAKLLNDRRGAG